MTWKSSEIYYEILAFLQKRNVSVKSGGGV